MVNKNGHPLLGCATRRDGTSLRAVGAWMVTVGPIAGRNGRSGMVTLCGNGPSGMAGVEIGQTICKPSRRTTMCQLAARQNGHEIEAAVEIEAAAEIDTANRNKRTLGPPSHTGGGPSVDLASRNLHSERTVVPQVGRWPAVLFEGVFDFFTGVFEIGLRLVALALIFGVLVAGHLADRFLGLTAEVLYLVLRLIRTAHSTCS